MIFDGFSVVKNCLRPESAPLKNMNLFQEILMETVIPTLRHDIMRQLKALREWSFFNSGYYY